MTKGPPYKVKDLARLTGISVRALHHDDALGLLSPAARSEAGYRLYGDADLLRLQQIVVGRELGLSLQEIKRSLDDPRFDGRMALESQRSQLEARQAQTSTMLAAIDAALAALSHQEEGRTMRDLTQDEITKLFDGFEPSKYEDEVKARRGDTGAYRESARRTARYGKADWEQYKAEARAILDEAARLHRSGMPVDGAEALARWRSGIATRSTAGSIPARRSGMSAWQICTKPTRASPRASMPTHRD